MQTILLVIHLLLAIALVALVLMQRSEGGALGIGGGTPFMGARAAANVLTRATAVLAALFMLTSVGLTVLARHGGGTRSILDAAPPSTPATNAPARPAEAPGAPSQAPAPAGGSDAPAEPAAPGPSAPISP